MRDSFIRISKSIIHYRHIGAVLVYTREWPLERCVNSVRFTSLQNGISVLGKSHIRSVTSLRNFPRCCLFDGSNDDLTDDNGPFSSFQTKSVSASSVYASFLQAIDGVLSLALCPQVASQAPQHVRSSERHKPLVVVALAASLSAWSFSWPASQGQHIHRSLQRLMSNIVKCQTVLSDFGHPLVVVRLAPKS